MAASADTSMQYDSSAGELSSPPSGSLSDPGSPARQVTRKEKTSNGRKSNSNKSMGEIVVGSDQRAGEQQQQAQPPPQQQAIFQQYQQPPPPGATTTGPGGRPQSLKRYDLIDGQWVQLTAAGVPRKKPGRKPGTVVKPKTGDATDGKVRKPRKPRDSSATGLQRKRKIAPASDADVEGGSSRFIAASSAPGSASSSHQIHAANTSASSPSLRHQHLQQQSSQHNTPSEQHYSPKMPKREGYPGSMQNILNADPPAQSPSKSAAIPVRTSGQSYDPIRGNYDPVRETMSSHGHNPYSTSGSPRGPATQMAHRSPSIASLIEPQAPAMASPSHSHHGYQPGSTSRLHAHESNSMPPSPSARPTSTPTPVGRTTIQDARRDLTSLAPPVQRPVVNQSNFTTIANGPIRKFSPKQKAHTGVSTPKTDNLDDMPQDSEGRSILDFGRARPGEETQAPTIVLTIPIQAGETNKYVNFMRMAEDRYGWDALHPRLAANRDRKARIAAAAASLEKVESGRESGDEMSVDLSDGEASNPENGGTSGPDAQAKPKKKRNFKEDQYDVDDDFVDDSEMLWEAQAAASRDGFFVYSGPLVPEVEKPAAGHEGPPKRGRGGRGSRGGGRGASTRGGTGAARATGPGSRGGSITRKPRITKSEKLQREREKAEREKMAQLTRTPTNGYVLQPTTPSFAVSELGA